MKEKITKEMKIGKVLEEKPELAEVFTKYFGPICLSCPAAANESIEEGAQAHDANLEKLLADLNKK